MSGSRYDEIYPMGTKGRFRARSLGHIKVMWLYYIGRDTRDDMYGVHGKRSIDGLDHHRPSLLTSKHCCVTVSQSEPGMS